MSMPVKELQKELRYGNVNAHRHFDCPFYQKCLEEAVKKYWSVFSCRNCPEFKKFQESSGRQQGAAVTVVNVDHV